MPREVILAAILLTGHCGVKHGSQIAPDSVDLNDDKRYLILTVRRLSPPAAMLREVIIVAARATLLTGHCSAKHGYQIAPDAEDLDDNERDR